MEKTCTYVIIDTLIGSPGLQVGGGFFVQIELAQGFMEEPE